MLLDIGAKTSNLLFFEKGKVFSRSINLGANSITQDFANESKLKFDVAEKLKIDEGFVSLGGAYEEPENPHQAAISKIARQFMTRLHIQVNQTMQFYRGQQGGSAPQRLFLSGGASVMPYTAQFFAEKLNVPVEYFNPLRNVQLDPSINLEELARVAHSLGEVVGLGLRNLAHCPVELNLMPESTLRWQSFNQKKPYFIATVFSLVAVVAAMGFLFDKLAGVKTDELEKVEEGRRAGEGEGSPVQEGLRRPEEDEGGSGSNRRLDGRPLLLGGRAERAAPGADPRGADHQEQTADGCGRVDRAVDHGRPQAGRRRRPGAGARRRAGAPGWTCCGSGMPADVMVWRGSGCQRRRHQPAEPAPAAATERPRAAASRKAQRGHERNRHAHHYLPRGESEGHFGSGRRPTRTSLIPCCRNCKTVPCLTRTRRRRTPTSDVINDEQTRTFTFSVVARLKHPLKL